MSKQLEKPFEYLKRRDGSEFAPITIKNWYKARAFVLDKLKDVAFKPGDKKHLNVVLYGDSDLMLSVARQVALSAHYINYDEENENENERKRTVITIVSQKTKVDIHKALVDEACLGNLLDYCKYTLFDDEVKNKDSYIDVEFLIVDDCPSIDANDTNVILINEPEVVSFCSTRYEDEVYGIDTRKAVYAERMYDLGTLIESLPAENIHDANRYSLALDVYQFEKLQKAIDTLINEDKWKDLVQVKMGLSNVFCADCFETRAASIELCRENKKQKDSVLWAKNNEALSKSEHARWVVEKLIMGFRPLDEKERLEDERLSPYKAKRKQYRNNLKNRAESPAHIDLCSYNNLRRTNPDDLKYDSFLMLAIPSILEKIRKEDE